MNEWEIKMLAHLTDEYIRWGDTITHFNAWEDYAAYKGISTAIDSLTNQHLLDYYMTGSDNFYKLNVAGQTVKWRLGIRQEIESLCQEYRALLAVSDGTVLIGSLWFERFKRRIEGGIWSIWAVDSLTIDQRGAFLGLSEEDKFKYFEEWLKK